MRMLQDGLRPQCRERQGRGVSTKTYGHLHEDDRAWFIADSFGWLVDQDRGEPMRAQKADGGGYTANRETDRRAPVDGCAASQ